MSFRGQKRGVYSHFLEFFKAVGCCGICNQQFAEPRRAKVNVPPLLWLDERHLGATAQNCLYSSTGASAILGWCGGFLLLLFHGVLYVAHLSRPLPRFMYIWRLHMVQFCPQSYGFGVNIISTAQLLQSKTNSFTSLLLFFLSVFCLLPYFGWMTLQLS